MGIPALWDTATPGIPSPGLWAKRLQRGARDGSLKQEEIIWLEQSKAPSQFALLTKL